MNEWMAGHSGDIMDRRASVDTGFVYLALRAAAFAVGATIAAHAERPSQPLLQELMRAQICMPGHARSLRLSDQAYFALREQVFARDGKPLSEGCHKRDTRPRCLILDHIRPLELCTAEDHCNDLSNMQLQPADEAAAKDKDEDAAHVAYCKGKFATPDEAQDWLMERW